MKKTFLHSILLSFLISVILSATVWAAPDTICIQGALKGADGKALTGERVWRVQFHDAFLTGNPLGAAIEGTLTAAPSGRFSLYLTPPPEALTSDGPIWYQLAIDSAATPDWTIDPSDVFPKRVAVHSVLFAQRANTAVSANYAVAAGSATTAKSAENALQADEALHANEATNAIRSKTADNAVFAAMADLATTASHADAAYFLQGESFVMPQTSPSPTLNAANLQAAYARASTLTPHGQALSYTNHAVVIVPPGRYDFSTGSLTLDIDYVDLIGLTTNRDAQHLFGVANGSGTGVLMQTAFHVRIENLTVEYKGPKVPPEDSTHPAAYFPNLVTLSGTTVRNCRFSSSKYSMRRGVDYGGTYEDVRAYHYAFGGGPGGNASGTFINCTAADGSFGNQGGEASGTFINCSANYHSFGAYGIASGTFTNCVARGYSFGYQGTASGTFTNCSGGAHSFAYRGTASGIFTNCEAGIYSFGYKGSASGIFTKCAGGSQSFGGGLDGTAPGGKFYYCKGGGNSFTTDAAGGTAPIFLYCVSGDAVYP